MLVDSGSFCHAINAEEELPGVEIITLDDSDKGKDGESASGNVIKRLGKVSTYGTVAGKTLNINWNVMDVTIPILSVRKFARDKFNNISGK